MLAERLAELEQSQGKPAAKAGAAAAPQRSNRAVDASIRHSRHAYPPDATLFVIARRGNGGPPLAVQRRPVGSWPVSLRLSDADAMLPGITLAGGGPLTLIARISAERTADRGQRRPLWRGRL